MDLLSVEKETYNTNKERLLAEYEGKYVLIRKDKIIDIFITEEDAIKEGYQRFGNKPFLVKQISQIDPVLNFTSYLLGVMRCQT